MNRYHNQCPHQHNPRHPSDYLTPHPKRKADTALALIIVGAWLLGFIVGSVL